MSDTETQVPAEATPVDYEAQYAKWEQERIEARAAIEREFPIDIARKVCEDFAARYDLSWQEAGYCGFGRPCVGFTRNSLWIQYDPIDTSKWRDEDRDAMYIIKSGDVRAPEGVEAYHKSDFLCVLKTETETALVKTIVGLVGATTGNVEAVKNAQEMPDPEVPVESTNRAISQMAHWVTEIEKRGDVSIVPYDSGADGLQAILDGTTTFHAIVVTPRN